MALEARLESSRPSISLLAYTHIHTVAMYGIVVANMQLFWMVQTRTRQADDGDSEIRLWPGCWCQAVASAKVSDRFVIVRSAPTTHLPLVLLPLLLFASLWSSPGSSITTVLLPLLRQPRAPPRPQHRAPRPPIPTPPPTVRPGGPCFAFYRRARPNRRPSPSSKLRVAPVCFTQLAPRIPRPLGPRSHRSLSLAHQLYPG